MSGDLDRSPYSIHPSVAMVQNWRATLPEKTGRTLEQWIALVKAEGPPSEKERRAWLKDHHQLGINSAWWVAERCAGKGEEGADPEAYLRAAAGWVDAMFGGKKKGQRPVFDELFRIGKGLRDDVRVCPCQTIVPFYRQHVFAQVKPTTITRIDLGLALGDTPAAGRFVDTGGLARKDRITHRIPITTPAEIDDLVVHWFQAAYDRDGE